MHVNRNVSCKYHSTSTGSSIGSGVLSLIHYNLDFTSKQFENLSTSFLCFSEKNSEGFGIMWISMGYFAGVIGSMSRPIIP